VDCAVGGRCGGCPWILQPYRQQLDSKRKQLLTLGVEDPPIDVVAEGGLRDRTDLQWRDGVLGMFDLVGSALVDVGACPALSEPLRKLLLTVQADPPPASVVTRLSLRLRVSPNGAQGIWIDAANLDVKALLTEGSWLLRRLEHAFVEIGQRKKPLTKELRLGKEPELRPWFETYLSDSRTSESRTQPLYLPVGGFTQPSLAANRVLVGRVVEMASGMGRILELGAGCGNFTLPLAQAGHPVIAVEIDELARDGLARAAGESGLPVELRSWDMYDPANALPDVDAVLADPPRSGLRRFLEVLAKNPPRDLLYVSCFVESLLADAERVRALGYAFAGARGVDQFPQTPHCEWIVHFRRA
jgi:23S rRNA (uracil1939-C5)-methyltransferase